MAYWIIPVSEENWYIIRELNIYGAPRDLSHLIKIGDILIFYVVRHKAQNLGSCFVGAYRVISKWYKEDKPLWQDEKKLQKTLYPYRVKIEPLKQGIVKLEKLLDRLSFIKKKEKWRIYLRGCPANFRKPLPEEDAKLILESMK